MMSTPDCHFTLCPITEEFKTRVQGRDKVEVKPGVHMVQYYKCDLVSELMWFIEMMGLSLYRRKRSYYRMEFWRWQEIKGCYSTQFVSVEHGQERYPWKYRLDFLVDRTGQSDRCLECLELMLFVVQRGYRSVVVGLDLLPEHLRELRQYLGDP